MVTFARFTTFDASIEHIIQIRDLFFAAFDEAFTEQDWEHVLGGHHVVAIDGETVVAHAAVVERVLEVAGRPFRTGYVEGVATHPARQRRGLGSRTMKELAQILESEYEMGALATSVQGFYERLGWIRWLGPTYVRYGSDLVRTEGEDGGIMVLQFGPSEDIDLSAPLSCPNRPGDDW